MSAWKGDKQYTSQLDKASKARAKKELNERNDKDRDSAVRALQNWASGQNWLRTPMVISCVSVSPTVNHEPIKPSPLPKKPWDEVSVDLCGPVQNGGEYFMVVICDYSRFPIFERIGNVSAQTVIPQLEKIWCLAGIPSIVRSDNGSPFNNHNFAQFAKQYGFEHRKITPLHPQASGIAEAFMKPLVKTLKTAEASGRNFQSSLSEFLLVYRSTPHPSTGLSPGEIMFNRKKKKKLPYFAVK